MKRIVPFANLILILWMTVVLLAVYLTINFADQTISPYYDTMVEASSLTQHCMDKIKQYKIDNDIALVKEDKLSTGMIGDKITAIRTTSGVLAAKRTACNPNWAAVIISYFVKANLKKGDEVAMVFSGSFPAMNLAVICAAEVYGLKTCIMVGVGASSYGATDPDFTFFDMVEYLYKESIISKRVDYLSFGGDGDIGKNFNEIDGVLIKDETRSLAEIMDSIRNRANNGYTTFIYESNFVENINLRLSYIKEKVPNIKFLINAGGSSVGVGVNMSSNTTSGYQSPSVYGYNLLSTFESRNKDWGLLSIMLANGIPVASMLNIKGLADKFGIEYDPKTLPGIGADYCNAYYTKGYSLVLPIIAIILTISLVLFYCLYGSKFGIERRKDERNYLLR